MSNAIIPKVKTLAKSCCVNFLGCYCLQLGLHTTWQPLRDSQSPAARSAGASRTGFATPRSFLPKAVLPSDLFGSR